MHVLNTYFYSCSRLLNVPILHPAVRTQVHVHTVHFSFEYLGSADSVMQFAAVDSRPTGRDHIVLFACIRIAAGLRRIWGSRSSGLPRTIFPVFRIQRLRLRRGESRNRVQSFGTFLGTRRRRASGRCVFQGLPLGSGLGSSAASAGAACWAVNALFGEPLSKMELVPAGLASEAHVSGYHADNIAPAIMGGFVMIQCVSSLSHSAWLDAVMK